MSHLSLDGCLQTDGGAVRYGIAGPAGASPLVLVHGTPFSSQVWHRLVPWLSGRFRVHYYDLLGYGASDMPDGDVSLGVQNGILAALLDRWELTSPHVVAHDFGGATALRAHLLDGAGFASLTLVDPVAIRPWGSPFVAHVREHEAAFAGMPDYAHRALVQAYLRTGIAREMSDNDLDRYLTPWTGPVGQPAFYRQIAQMELSHTDAIEDLLADIRCPMQLLWGEADAWIPIATGRRLAGRLPLERFLPIPGAGHLVQEDAPEAIIAALADFAPLGGFAVAA